MPVPYTIVRIDPVWRCPCGAPIKAFDFRIEPDEITLDCRNCHRRLLTVESGTEAIVALCSIPLILVEASLWKRKLHLPGTDKEAARQKALQLFPSQHALLARKKDHGRAEAALIAVASLERAP
jgi:hypothetical protein